MRFVTVLLTTFVFVAFAMTSFAQSPAGITSRPAALSAPPAAAPEKRIAFVVGNESYAAGALPTAANDAGLVAQTLQAAGFEVIGARDLDADMLRRSYADFLKRVTDAGPDTVAFVYLAGYGLQYGPANYYVPIGATVSRDLDIPIETIRISDLTGPLGGLNLKARFMVLDAAYKTPFETSGAPLAGGFSEVDAAPGSLIAYNAAPGTLAPVGKQNYGLYAQSLAAMLREGGLPPDEIFDRVRLRVNEQSKGAEVPWDSSKIDVAFRFFERKPNAPAPAATPEQVAALTTKPIKDLPVREAYTAAVARDTVQSYSAFTAAYGADPLAKRARVLLAARREAVTWQRTVAIDTPDAYWSYLSRYPRGPHASGARLRLGELSAAAAPPESFQAIGYDVPPPPPDEIVYVDRPVIDFDDPGYDLPPPPPPPDYWLPPVPVAFVDLPPPPPPPGLFFLPVPAFVALPVYYDPPPYVAYPADNYFYGAGGGRDVFISNTRVVNNIHESVPAGGPRLGPAGGSGAVRGAIGAAALGAAAVALPIAVRQHATALERRGITTPEQLRAARQQPGGPLGGAPGAPRPNGAAPLTGAAGRNRGLPAGERLPGANGRPLPTLNKGRPVPGAAAQPNGAQGERPGSPATRRDNAVRPATASQNTAARGAERQRQDAARQQQEHGRQERQQVEQRQQQERGRQQRQQVEQRQQAQQRQQFQQRQQVQERQQVQQRRQAQQRQQQEHGRQQQEHGRQQQEQGLQQQRQQAPRESFGRPGGGPPNGFGGRPGGTPGGFGRPAGGPSNGFGGRPGGAPGGFGGGHPGGGAPGGFGGGRPGGGAPGGGHPGGGASGGGHPGGGAPGGHF